MDVSSTTWSRVSKAVVDFVPATGVEPIDVVISMRDILERSGGNVLSLGPPIRLQVSDESLVEILNTLSYESVYVRHWPFSISEPRDPTGARPDGSQE